MSAVTHSRKRYVFVCVACRGLADATRNDRLTCSPACRVRLHRHPELLASVRRAAEQCHVAIASILQGAAIDRLRPDLGNAILAGTHTFEDVRTDVYLAYLAALRAAMNRRTA
jgi:hypothetical protein